MQFRIKGVKLTGARLGNDLKSTTRMLNIFRPTAIIGMKNIAVESTGARSLKIK